VRGPAHLRKRRMSGGDAYNIVGFGVVGGRESAVTCREPRSGSLGTRARLLVGWSLLG